MRSYRVLSAIRSHIQLSVRAMGQKEVKNFDYLLLGAGSGGIASARRAAEFGVKVGIIEHGPLGGTCVSTTFLSLI